MKKAQRIATVPPYLFAQIDQKKQEALDKGVDIISLGIGDPDRPTFPNIVEKMHQAIDNPTNHDYPPYAGTKNFREAAVKFYKKRFGVDFDPEDVVSVIGGKEGIAHAYMAFSNPGDTALVPDPGYPVYAIWARFMGVEPYFLPLTKENNFLPDLDSIDPQIAQKAAMLWLNYPNNPTGAVAPLEYYQKAVDFCKHYDILLCSDMAYSEMAYDNYKPLSVFNAQGAKDVAIEFYSLSKGYNMTGWRTGFALGNKEAMKAFAIIKTNTDSGIFKAIQEASVEALLSEESLRYQNEQNEKIYHERRDVLVEGLNDLGWNLVKPQATFYVWAPVPKGYSSAQFCSEVLEKCGVILVPGNGYGPSGEGYFRAAITQSTDRIREAVARMKQAGIRFA